MGSPPRLPRSQPAWPDRDPLSVPFSPDATTLTPALEAILNDHDHALFLARLGDQLRFKAMPANTRPIVSYALDQAAFASPFGTAPYPAFVALKQAINACLGAARHIRVTCPLGTDFSGSPIPAETEQPADVSIKRFPMSVFAPMPAVSFAGRVMVAHLICGTGSRYYEPFGYPVHAPLAATINAGRIVRWEGEPGEVQRVEAHYREVSSRYGLDADFVHSWHAGSIRAVRIPGRHMTAMNAGADRLLAIRACCIFIPVAPMLPARFAGMWWTRPLRSMAASFGITAGSALMPSPHEGDCVGAP